MTEPIDIDDKLESEYNARAARPDYDRVLGDWNRRSEAFRSASGGFLDAAYGPGDRHRLDLFIASEGAPTLVYLHGGYWQRGDKSIYSFVAAPFVAEGVNVVVMNYTLCPETTVPGITEEIRQGLIWLYRNGGEYGLAADQVHLTGHSAGGHLTAMMLATTWEELGADLPPDLVKSGIPISGLYDLAPLRRTSINRGAGIDANAVRHCSPRDLRPSPGARALAVVGGAETQAFHDQAADLAARWSAAGARVEQYVEPGVDHFDVVNRLADPDSELFRKAMASLNPQ
ncbi:MAG: alpha/beta hydrolase [Gammaproteobacteria bacterium]|nr:alpha/beta hydrolase [Gammaproteobacteria bacterium]